MKFLDPKTDTAFKKLFGNEHRKNLTMSLLNSLLERSEGHLITDVSFRDNGNLPEILSKKTSFVDINCKISPSKTSLSLIDENPEFVKKSFSSNSLLLTSNL